MRIVIITLGIYPLQTGGVELHSYHHLQKLLERGHEVVCFTKRRKWDNPAEASKSYPVHVIGFAAPILGPVSFLIGASIRLLAMRDNVDVVHVHYATYFLIPAYILRLLTGTPYISSCRGSDLIYGSRHPTWRRLQTFLLRRSSFVTGLSSQMNRILTEEYRLPEKQILTLPNVIDDEEIERISSVPYARRSSSKIVFLGNLKPVKDPMTTVRAFKLLTEKMADVELVLIGDGPTRTEILEFARENGIEKRVVLKGAIPHLDALRELSSADALVISSVSEGSPNVAVEAMALGVPIVATGVGGIMDLVINGRNGLLAPPKSPEKLADAMYRVLSNKCLAHSIIEEGRRKAEKLTWKNLILAYENLYKSAAQDSRGAC